MALNLPSMQGAVQVVMTLDTLEAVLSQFPHLEVFPVVHQPGDLPTYAFKAKEVPPATPALQPIKSPYIPRVPRRKPARP